jgi:mannosyltransferase OCH1-like enzyme
MMVLVVHRLVSGSYLSTHPMTDENVLRSFQLPFFPSLTEKQIMERGMLPASYKLVPPSPGKKVPRVIWVAVSNSSEELPGPLREFFQRNSGWQVNVIGNTEKDAFIDTVFANTSVQLAYHIISPLLGAAKADIWRYAVLYLFGGVYIDYDSDIRVPLDTVVEPEDTLIVSEEGSNFHECYIPSYPLSSNSTFTKYKYGTDLTAGNGVDAAKPNPYISGKHPETGHPIFFDGKFIVQWAIIAAPGNLLFHRTLANLIDLLYRDYLRETVILLHRHTHRMLQLLCTTNYVFTHTLRQLLIEGSQGGAIVKPRVLHDDWREYKGKCKAIHTGFDPNHYR